MGQFVTIAGWWHYVKPQFVLVNQGNLFMGLGSIHVMYIYMCTIVLCMRMCKTVYVHKRVSMYKSMHVYMCQHTHLYRHIWSLFLLSVNKYSMWPFLMFYQLGQPIFSKRGAAALLRRTLSQTMTKEFLLISRGTKVSMYKSMLLGSNAGSSWLHMNLVPIYV